MSGKGGVVGDELTEVGGPDLDEDLAAFLLLDEYALANELDHQLWVAPLQPIVSSISSPSDDLEESKTITPSSPRSAAESQDHDESILEQERRRRHRESMARYRQERRDRVDAMKAQEVALHRILSQVLSHNKYIGNGSAASKTSLQRHQIRYTELVRSREALLMEKRDLTDKLLFYDQRTRAFQSISEQVFSKSLFVFPRTPGGVWLRYEENEAPFYYEPIHEELCRKTIALGLTKMAQLLRELPHTSLPQPPAISAGNLFGWNSERVFKVTEHSVPVMLFRFSRRVPKSRATLDEMQERSWKIYTSPDVMARSSAASVRAQVVQQVHDDIVIMIRNAPEKKSAGRSRYLGLYHKMRSGDDLESNPRNGRSAMIFTMLMNRAPKEEIADLTPSVRKSGSWLKDGCALLRFTEKPTTPSNRDGGIDVEYMGYVECLDLMHGEHMWTELCLLMLLWEQAVVPQSLLTG